MKVKIRHKELAEELAKRSLSQNAWAMRIGISPGHLSNLVSGKRPYVNTRTQRRLLEALGVPFERIFEIEVEDADREQRPAPRPLIDWRLLGWRLQLGRAGPVAVRSRPRPLSALGSDVRLALRSLARRPGFAAVVVLTLGLGLGVSSTAFAVLNSVLLRPLPYPGAENIVRVFNRLTADGERDGIAYHDLQSWIENSSSFEALAHYQTAGMHVSIGEEPVSVVAMRVTQGFSEVFGVPPVLGRWFAPEEFADGWTSGSVVLSEGLWQRHFGGDPEILGTVLAIDEMPHVVVGVMPNRFRVTGPFRHEAAEIWTAHDLDHWGRFRRGARLTSVVARLKPLTDPGKAADELARLRAVEEPEVAAAPVVEPLRDFVTADTRALVWLISGLAIFVLAVAGINYSTLLLGAGMTRHHEVAVRRAVGAGGWALTRKLAIEALFCALAGSAIGLVGARFLTAWIAASAPMEMPRLAETGIDWAVFSAALGLATLVGVAASIVPGLWMGCLDVVAGLKNRQGLSGLALGRHLGRFLVTAQIALAFTLLAGGTLFFHSFWRLVNSDPGFRNWNVITVRVGRLLADREVSHLDRVGALESLLERLEALDDVIGTAIGPHPFVGFGVGIGVVVEGLTEIERRVGVAPVSPDYFRTLGVPIISGRAPAESDRHDGERVIVVNEALARLLFHGANPVGRRLGYETGEGHQWFRIVGLTADIRYTRPDEEVRPTVFGFHGDWPVFGPFLLIQTRSDPDEMLETVRQIVWSFEPERPITRLATLNDLLAESVADRRLALTGVLFLSCTAVVLAAIGLYGMVSLLSAQRTHEVGVRLALGARRADISRLVLGDGLKLGVAGGIAGLAITLMAAPLIQDHLFEISATDPLSLGVSMALLLAIVLAASFLPARRATRVDPRKVLADA